MESPPRRPASRRSSGQTGGLRTSRQACRPPLRRPGCASSPGSTAGPGGGDRHGRCLGGRMERPSDPTRAPRMVSVARGRSRSARASLRSGWTVPLTHCRRSRASTRRVSTSSGGTETVHRRSGNPRRSGGRSIISGGSAIPGSPLTTPSIATRYRQESAKHQRKLRGISFGCPQLLSPETCHLFATPLPSSGDEYIREPMPPLSFPRGVRHMGSCHPPSLFSDRNLQERTAPR